MDRFLRGCEITFHCSKGIAVCPGYTTANLLLFACAAGDSGGPQGVPNVRVEAYNAFKYANQSGYLP